MRHRFSKMRASIVESSAHEARRRKPNRIRGLTQLNPFFFLLFSVTGVCKCRSRPFLCLCYICVYPRQRDSQNAPIALLSSSSCARASPPRLNCRAGISRNDAVGSVSSVPESLRTTTPERSRSSNESTVTVSQSVARDIRAASCTQSPASRCSVLRAPASPERPSRAARPIRIATGRHSARPRGKRRRVLP